MWSPSSDQRSSIEHADFELAPGEMLAAAIGQRTEVEDVTAVLLLTDEDEYNALAATTVAGYSSNPVYRLATGPDGVVPYAAGETLFAPDLDRSALTGRYAAGARITTQPADDGVPPACDLLFLVDPEGVLIPVTGSRSPDPHPGDTLVLLGPSASASQPVTAPTRVTPS
jgi:hypothetical protein